MEEIWKEFEIELVLKNESEIIGDGAPKEKGKCNIDISKVCGFYSNMNENDEESTTLLFISGDQITILYPYEDFKVMHTFKD